MEMASIIIGGLGLAVGISALILAYKINKTTQEHNQDLHISTLKTQEKIDDIINRLIDKIPKDYRYLSISGYMYSDNLRLYDFKTVQEQKDPITKLENIVYNRDENIEWLSEKALEELFSDKERAGVLLLISKDLNWWNYFQDKMFDEKYFNIEIEKYDYYNFCKVGEHYQRVYYREMRVWYNLTPITEKPKRKENENGKY